jgi:hypothetical protein
LDEVEDDSTELGVQRLVLPEFMIEIEAVSG